MKYFDDRVPTDTGITPRRDGHTVFMGGWDTPRVFGGGKSGPGISNDAERGLGIFDYFETI